MSILETIIEKYHLIPDSQLVNWEKGTNGVDCWFDTDDCRQHRCLSFEDFKFIKRLQELNNELKELKDKRIYLSPSDYEDISDLYQEKLELGWAIKDCEQEIQSLIESYTTVMKTTE